MNVNMYQHFRKDEHPFIDLVFGWIAQAEYRYTAVLTDFLDPRQSYILESIVHNHQIQCSFFGGYEQAERKRALIYPDYYQLHTNDFDVSLFSISYPSKFGALSHGKILGSLLNCGIKRDKFGDIISDGERWQVFITADVARFVAMSVERIDKVKVNMHEVDYADLLVPRDEWIVENIIVTSLRLDNMIACAYRISRQQAKQLVDSGKVKVNWCETSRTDFSLELFDIVSVRGLGRFQLQNINGKTKKDKYILSIGRLKK